MTETLSRGDFLNSYIESYERVLTSSYTKVRTRKRIKRIKFAGEYIETACLALIKICPEFPEKIQIFES